MGKLGTAIEKVANIPVGVLWNAANNHAIISITDVAGTIVYANDLFSKISGYAIEELTGQNHRIVKSAAHTADFYSDLWHTISAGRVWNGEVCNCHKSGTPYWVWATIVPVLDENGLPTHYVSFRTDITNEKLQLETMKKLEFAEEELLRLAPFGIARLKERVVIKANEEFHRLLGYSSGELEGKSTRVFYHSDQQFVDVGTKAYEPLARGEHVKYEDELRRKNGDSLYVIAGTCSLNQSAPESDTLYLIQDISPHKALEEELAKSARKNEAISAAKTEFMAIVSHELKTPLNGIFGATQLLTMAPNESNDELLREIQANVNRLMKIVNEVVEYTSYDLRDVIANEPINLKTLFLVVAEKFEFQSIEKGIEFSLNTPDALDEDFFTDEKCGGHGISDSRIS